MSFFRCVETVINSVWLVKTIQILSIVVTLLTLVTQVYALLAFNDAAAVSGLVLLGPALSSMRLSGGSIPNGNQQAIDRDAEVCPRAMNLMLGSSQGNTTTKGLDNGSKGEGATSAPASTRSTSGGSTVEKGVMASTIATAARDGATAVSEEQELGGSSETKNVEAVLSQNVLPDPAVPLESDAALASGTGLASVSSSFQTDA